MAEKLPGKGLLGWLGRQVGHVRSACRTDPAKRTVHRAVQVQEAKVPGSEHVTLRRTTIDEVIVKPGGTGAPPVGGSESQKR